MVSLFVRRSWPREAYNQQYCCKREAAISDETIHILFARNTFAADLLPVIRTACSFLAAALANIHASMIFYPKEYVTSVDSTMHRRFGCASSRRYNGRGKSVVY